MGAFMAACQLYGWTPMPATAKVLMDYTAHVFINETITGDSFWTRIYGIRAEHKKRGLTLNVTAAAMPQLNLMMKAFRKARPSKQRKKTAVSMEVLTRLMSPMNKRGITQQTLRAVLTFAYGGMLRVSEYTYGPRARSSPTIDHITELTDQHLVYEFNASKTNQDQRTERVVMCCRCPSPCAVHEVKKMLAMRPGAKGHEPLFKMKSGGSPTAAEINHLIHHLCLETGFDPEEITSHCIRAGSITEALWSGMNDTVVQVMSRHKALDSMVPYKKFTSEAMTEMASRAYKELRERTSSMSNEHGARAQSKNSRARKHRK